MRHGPRVSGDLFDARGARCGALHAFALSEVERGLTIRRAPDAPPPCEASFSAALAAALGGAPAARWTARVVTAEEGTDPARALAWTAVASDALRANGFRRTGAREEVSLALDAAAVRAWVEAHAASPIRWALRALGDPRALARTAPLLQRAARGDPDTDDAEDALAWLRALAEDDDYPEDSSRLAVGSLDESEVALVIAQRHAASGVARITYLGLDPARRGAGLGRAVYAQGLSLARDLGAARYVGGTSTENRPMRALFASVGAAPWRSLDTWSLAR